ncbi:MAG: hypothetical protein V1897_03665 [Pseudomonadota bacterium]
MDPNIDRFIADASKLRVAVSELGKNLASCSRKSISGPVFHRAAYAAMFRELAGEAAATERLVLEIAAVLGKYVPSARKNADGIALSSNQITEVTEFLEMAKRPLFAALAPKAPYLHPGLHAIAPRDC